MSNNISTSSKRWDLSIEMLKAIAAILVMNSHMDAMYGEYSYLGTGGAIGDALFFFCSGYALFLSTRMESFFNWYKRRIQRIIPSVCVAFLICFLCSKINVHTHVGGIWFIECILIYYVLLYPIKRYASDYLWWIMVAVALICLAWYYMIGPHPIADGNIYGRSFYKWGFYFLFMLFGGICGKWRINQKLNLVSSKESILKGNNTPNILVSGAGLLLSLLLFYTLYIYTKRLPILEPYQLLSLIPLLGVCWFLWRLASANFVEKMMNSTFIGLALRFIGSLCLEILICQQFVFTTKLNTIFPWNIPLIMIGVILFAYVVRTLSRILLQTFQKEDYDWHEIITPI